MIGLLSILGWTCFTIYVAVAIVSLFSFISEKEWRAVSRGVLLFLPTLTAFGFILSFSSITALAALTNGLRIEAIIFLPAFALNMAASVLVGQNLGAGKPDRASSIGWKIALTGALILSTLAAVIFIWAESFASLLAKDTLVLRETVRYLRITMFSEPFMAVSMVLAGSLQGAGDTRGAMRVIIIGMWCVRLPLAFAMAIVLGYGAVGVWIAMVTSMTIQGLLMARHFHQGKWKQIQLG